MTDQQGNAFENVPRTAREHFVLHLFAAIYRLVNHVRRLAELGGDNLDAILNDYPFLAGYFGDVLHLMPQGLTWEGAPDWWDEQIGAWERAAGDVHLPLRALAAEAGLAARGRLALVLLGLVEEDSRFGTLFARLQEPLPGRRPGLELVAAVLRDHRRPEGVDPWHVCRPLIAAGLVDVENPAAARSEWVLRVPAMLWDVLRGEVSAEPAPWCRFHPPAGLAQVAGLVLPGPFLERLAAIPPLLRAGTAAAVVLRGTPGSDRLRVMGALAEALGRGMAVVDGAVTRDAPAWARLGPFCTMARALPVVVCDLAPGETAELPPLAGYSGPLGILLGLEGGLQGPPAERAITLTLPMAGLGERMRCWQEALAGHPAADLPAIAERFQMPAGYIRQAAPMAVAYAALDRRDAVEPRDVRDAARALNRQLLDTLATRLEVEGTWDRLAVGEATAAKLRELEQRCRHRERLLNHLAPAFDAGSNRGVRALLTGASGTGKTLAARILAAELGMDLYRVDLSAVVNKYIGETEKNLQRVLSRAEELDVILLLDEGDALLGRRTEVRSANDRYANLETNYLLQRLEHYQGIVVITTNAGENIDRAFQRRMDIVVSFLPPQAPERWRIWQLHLPADHAVSPALLQDVSVRCALNGGQIRNAALHATLLAVDDGSGVVSDWHLDEAIRSEYRKAGAACPMDGGTRPGPRGDRVEAFLQALSS